MRVKEVGILSSYVEGESKESSDLDIPWSSRIMVIFTLIYRHITSTRLVRKPPWGKRAPLG